MPNSEVCGKCQFFQQNSPVSVSELGNAGICIRPGIDVTRTYQNQTPIQALEADNKAGLARSMRVEGWTCFQPIGQKIVIPKELFRDVGGDLVGGVTLEVTGDMDAQTRLILLKSLRIGIKHWTDLFEKKNS